MIFPMINLQACVKFRMYSSYAVDLRAQDQIVVAIEPAHSFSQAVHEALVLTHQIGMAPDTKLVSPGCFAGSQTSLKILREFARHAEKVSGKVVDQVPAVLLHQDVFSQFIPQGFILNDAEASA